MADKVITTVNQALINDSILSGLLSSSSFGDSAVYANWAERESTFDYIVLDWSSLPDNHWAKRSANLEIHIFSKGPSTIAADKIQERLEEILDRQLFESDESGLIRLFLRNESNVPNEENVVHVVINFEVIYWRKEFIGQLI